MTNNLPFYMHDAVTRINETIDLDWKAVHFTGHRPNKLDGYDPYSAGNRQMLLVLRSIIEQKIQEGVRVFITGMALGIDMWAARIVLALKPANTQIELHAYIPCAGQDSRWHTDSKKEYADILSKADVVYYVDENPYTSPSCMHQRNEAMIASSNETIAVWDGSLGGTGGTVKLAKGMLVDKVTVLHPKTLKVTTY